MSGLVRANTAYTMASNAWSTSELVDGLGHILTDAKNELPDDLAQLEDLLDADVFVLSIPVQFVWVNYLSYSTRTNHFWHKLVVGVHRMHIYERIKYDKLNLYTHHLGIAGDGKSSCQHWGPPGCCLVPSNTCHICLHYTRGTIIII